MAEQNLTLGIDIGTTKVAVVVLDPHTGTLLHSGSRITNSYLPMPAGYAEQDVSQIFSALDTVISEIPSPLLTAVSAIGITGQMHGMLLWNPKSGARSNLITWQDQRCNYGGFLEKLREQTGDHSLNTGYGCASLAWLCRNDQKSLDQYSCASTIHDHLASLMCDLEHSHTDTSDGASWGCFDIAKGDWKRDSIKLAGIPERILPKVKPCGSKLGTLSESFAKRWGVKAKIPVTTPLGDNQASLFATITQPESQLALTIGTGGQLSLVLSDLPEQSGRPVKYEVRPYVDGKYIAVAASLCGGDGFAFVANTVEAWCKELEIAAPSRDAIFSKLNNLALSVRESPLSVQTSFLGERFAPELRGSISNIDLENLTLTNLSHAACRSVVRNLKEMLPDELWRGRRSLVGSGNAIRKLPIFQRIIEEEFQMDLELLEGREEAATGAAMVAARLI